MSTKPLPCMDLVKCLGYQECMNMVVLLGCRSSMEEEVPFEAEHVLQELYNLDAVVQGVQAGTWER